MNENTNDQHPLYKALETFGNIFALNVLFVICCLPVVTIGASVTALYAMTMRLVRKEEGMIVKGFFGYFKQNFKKATLTWLLILLACFIITMQFVYLQVYDTNLNTFYIYLIVVELAAMALTLPFLFPLMARFENSIFNTFKNAFLLSISNVGAWFKILLAWGLPFFLSFNYAIVILSIWYLWLLIIFGLIAYGTSFTLNRVFKKVAVAQGGEEREAQEDLEERTHVEGIRERASLEIFEAKNAAEEDAAE